LGTKGICTSITVLVLSIIFVSSFSSVYAASPTVNVIDQGSSVDIIGIDSIAGMGSVIVQGEPVMSFESQFCSNPINEVVVNHPTANLPATVTVENCNSPPEQTIVCVGTDLSQTAGDCNGSVESSDADEATEKMMQTLTILTKEECAFRALFEGDPLVLKESSQTECPDGVFNEAFRISVEYVPPLSNAVTSSSVAEQEVIISLPNFIDELNTKTIRVDIVYNATESAPKIINIRPSGQNFDTCFFNFFTSTVDPNNIATLSEFWKCNPNPDDEIITIDISGAKVFSVGAVTESFDRNAVGGNIIPLDSTMVLAAGAQYTAAWMIPVIVSAIGIGIVIARKF